MKVQIYLISLILSSSLSFSQSLNFSSDSTILWQDEFSIDGSVDTLKWYQQHILPNGKNWFSGEIQHYTNRDTNAYVKDGFLHIVAQKETFTDQGVTFYYTSARLNSKFAFTYGRVQTRAKMPTGSGLWTSIWTLGKNIKENGAFWNDAFGSVQWPYCGETNILEYWGAIPNSILGGAHTPDGWGSNAHQGQINIQNAESEFHVYDIIWKPDVIIFLVDGIEYYRYNPTPKDSTSWPFTEDQYLLANVAVHPDIDPNFQKTELVIDYIRVYDVDSTTFVNSTTPNEYEVEVYPNPFQEFVLLKNQSDQLIQFQVLSAEGSLVHKGNFQTTFRWESPNLPKGIYFLHLQNENGIEVKKLIKN